jgi:hypothetical protein
MYSALKFGIIIEKGQTYLASSQQAHLEPLIAYLPAANSHLLAAFFPGEAL